MSLRIFINSAILATTQLYVTAVIYDNYVVWHEHSMAYYATRTCVIISSSARDSTELRLFHKLCVYFTLYERIGRPTKDINKQSSTFSRRHSTVLTHHHSPTPKYRGRQLLIHFSLQRKQRLYKRKKAWKEKREHQSGIVADASTGAAIISSQYLTFMPASWIAPLSF